MELLIEIVGLTIAFLAGMYCGYDLKRDFDKQDRIDKKILDNFNKRFRR